MLCGADVRSEPGLRVGEPETGPAWEQACSWLMLVGGSPLLKTCAYPSRFHFQMNNEPLRAFPLCQAQTEGADRLPSRARAPTRSHSRQAPMPAAPEPGQAAVLRAGRAAPSARCVLRTRAAPPLAQARGSCVFGRVPEGDPRLPESVPDGRFSRGDPALCLTGLWVPRGTTQTAASPWWEFRFAVAGVSNWWEETADEIN